MEKQKNGELSRMFGYAGKFHVLTVLGCVLSGISTILSMLPFVCIWLVIRDLIQAFAAGDISLANGIYSSMWKDYQTSIAWKVGKEDEQHD